MTQVRASLPVDAAAVAAVLRQSVRELCHADHRGDARMLERWLGNKTPESVEAWIESADRYCATAVSATGEVMGFGMLNRDGEIALLYVSPSCVKCGVGRALLEALEQHARHWGLAELSLDSTKTAQAFYASHGYRSTDSCSDRSDGLFCHAMRKRLPPGLWAGQVVHAAALAVLLALTWAAWVSVGKPNPVAFWCAIAIPVAHQVYVWLCWRLEMAAAVSRTIGFLAYLVVFFVLLGGRVVALGALAWLDAGSLQLPALPRVTLTVVLGAVWIYTAYSIRRYFGFVRAAGADHFDPAFRDLPLVRDGIFRYTRNGMYVFGFLILWVIAIGFDSSAALIAAAFNHAYIWVHFYATERPDMRYLYTS